MGDLRNYQVGAVEAATNFCRYRSGNGYVTAPGGSGKSHMIAALAEALLPARVVILARNEKLLTQNRSKLSNPLLAGIYCAGLNSWDMSRPITIASIQSIASVDGQNWDYALVDECDEIHPDPESNTQYWKFFRNNGMPRIIGFTATPFRTQSGKISWGEEIANIPLTPLVQAGHLIPPINKVGATIDLSSITVNIGEYAVGELEEIYTDPELLRISIEKLLQYSADRNHVIVFTQSLKHSDMLAYNLELNGQTCISVSGDTDKEDLAFILNDFEEGRYKFLLNCQLLTVGIDLPCIDMVALLRASKSKRLVEQMIYRGTRPHVPTNKQNFLLLDMGNNLMEHGPLGSPFIEKAKREKNPQPAGKICPTCETFVAGIGIKECPDCAYQFPEAEAPKVNHSAHADMESRTYYANAVDSDIVTYDVTDVSYKMRKSKAGNDMLVVSYYCGYGQYGTIADFLLPYHDSDGMRGKFSTFFRDRGVKLEQDTRNYTGDEIVFLAEGLKKPQHIVVSHEEKYPRIKQYIWESHVTPASKILDDEILF